MLFPDTIATNGQGTETVLQHYYGYYRCAIRDALNRPSRTPFQCGGLQGYEQLVGINTHLNNRRIQNGPDPYLDQLAHYVHKALRSTASLAKEVRQAHAMLIQVERYLAGVPQPNLETNSRQANLSTPGSKAVEQELQRMVSDLVQQSDPCPLVQRLARTWDTMSKTWLPDILHCYDIPGLPRSNLNLESVFGILRRAQRRISGRKETTPLRTFGPGEITLLSLDDEEILPLLQSVPPDEYWSQRRRQEEREEPRRWLIRLHRDPAHALAQLDEQLYAVVNVQIGASSSAPDDP